MLNPLFPIPRVIQTWEFGKAWDAGTAKTNFRITRYKTLKQERIMHLGEKLASLSPYETVMALGSMLPAHATSTHVTIDYRGRRMVAIDGYEGSVEINTLASIYLKAAPFQWGIIVSLRERLECYSLWKRVNQLYVDSDAELAKTTLFKYLVPLTEMRPYCRACWGDPMAIIRLEDGFFHDTRQSLFHFSREEFRSLWPRQDPIGKSYVFRLPENECHWWANKEMVKQAAATEI